MIRLVAVLDQASHTLLGGLRELLKRGGSGRPWHEVEHVQPDAGQPGPAGRAFEDAPTELLPPGAAAQRAGPRPPGGAAPQRRIHLPEHINWASTPGRRYNREGEPYLRIPLPGGVRTMKPDSPGWWVPVRTDANAPGYSQAHLRPARGDQRGQGTPPAGAPSLRAPVRNMWEWLTSKARNFYGAAGKGTNA